MPQRARSPMNRPWFVALETASPCALLVSTPPAYAKVGPWLSVKNCEMHAMSLALAEAVPRSQTSDTSPE